MKPPDRDDPGRDRSGRDTFHTRPSCPGGPMIIGFLGAGQMAQTLAPVWLRAGHRVLLANSRGPASLADLVATLGPAASAVTPPELAGADVVVLATRWDQLPKALAGVRPLPGKVL